MNEELPENCPAHSDRVMEWDGYNFVCPGCVLDPKESDPEW